MRIDPADIKKRFAAMDDEALLDVDRDELSEMAQGIYDEEVAARGLDEGEDADGIEELDVTFDEDGAPVDVDAEEDAEQPDWMEEAVCVCTFETTPGSTAVGDVLKARAVLLAAEIPCTMAVQELPPQREGHPPRKEVALFVPGPVHLHAVSVLDRDLFNETHEEEWQRHFEAISDADLLALRPEVFTAGLLDRVARMKRVYAEETARRGLKR